MNILFIHEVDWIEKVVFDLHYLAEGLSLRGHNVYVIDYEDTWSTNGSSGLGTLKTRELGKIPRAFDNSSVSVIRPGSIKITGISRISAAVTHYLAIRRTIREKRIDAIVLYSVPTNGIQAINLAKKYNIPVIFRSIDILHQLVPYPVLRSLTRFLEKRVYPRADLILTLTPKGSGYVKELGAAEEKIRWLKMPVDTGIFHPLPDTAEMWRELGYRESDQIIVFIGTLFEFSGLDGLIEVFPKILGEVPDARLLIVGDGPQRTALEKIIGETGLSEKVIITGFKPYSTMPSYINLASLCVLPFRIVRATRDIFPGKITQYLACGKVVIATPLPGTTAVIPEGQDYLVYVSGSDEMAEKIISLLKSHKQRRQSEQKAIEYVTNEHSYVKISEKLEEYITEVIKKKNGELS